MSVSQPKTQFSSTNLSAKIQKKKICIEGKKIETQNIASLQMSGRRGSNPRPAAWEAAALPTELLPQFNL